MNSTVSELAEQLDSLEKQIREAEELPWEDIEQVLNELSEDVDKCLYGRACYYAAYHMLYCGRTEAVLRYLNESVRCLIGTGELRELARCYNMFGILAHAQNNMTLAMEQYEKALDYAGRYKDKMVYNGVLSNVADAYFRVGAYERAVQCYEECLGSYESSVGSYARAIVNYRKMLASYGYCLLLADKVTAATDIADRLLGMSCDINCELATRLPTYTFLAFLYYKRKELGRVELALRIAVDVALNMEQVSAEYDALLNLLQFLSLTGRQDYLCEVLPDLESKAAIERNGGFLLQLLLIHMRNCDEDMEKDEFRMNTEMFLRVKEECEKNENAQIMHLLELRSQLHQIEEEQKALEQTNSKLLYQVDHDELSGLCNKNCLNRYLEEAFEEAVQKQFPLGILFLDIDFFKQMNDYYGHQQGDACICAIAESLRECMSEDFAARYGGDEFVVVMRNRSREYVKERAEALMQSVRKKAIPHKCSSAADIMTITVGVVHRIPQKQNRVWDFLSAADETLYQQKKEKKGCVRFYEE